ncbi:unnamed protein product [Echinostoma caproni]|uniref:AAA_11 domain-containing protein n=1 Tax=Echinostoma caproni TaxID=27848 RepID=A0A183ADV1_9TREM|nr:unnamed protein product [Echinostoma caproni]
MLHALSFTSILIDECGQAVEPECLVPIVRNPSRLVLVGDQCQLGPVVHCQEAIDAGYDMSLFERLKKLGAPLVRLDVSINNNRRSETLKVMAVS